MGKSKDIFIDEKEKEMAIQGNKSTDEVFIIHLCNMTDRVENGEVDALKFFLSLKKIEGIIKNIKAQINQSAIKEAATYNEKTFDYLGAKITLKNAAGRWNFEGIQSIETARDSLKLLQDKSKDAYKQEQKGSVLLDKDTGEVIEAASYISGGEVLSISFL